MFKNWTNFNHSNFFFLIVYAFITIELEMGLSTAAILKSDFIL